ncbi:MAG: hypothetical protein ABRQ37_28275, partial [Candidatus Eremiobacterota bacterium]
GIIEGNYVTTDDVNDFIAGGGISNTVYKVSGTIMKGTCTLKGIKIGKNHLYGQNLLINFPNAYGGGIYNTSAMTVTKNLIYRNNTSGYGAGICNDFWCGEANRVVAIGDCTINSSTVGDINHAFLYGGGIQNYATLTINNSYIQSNVANHCGGGIGEYSANYNIYHVRATCTLNNSIIGGDTEADGNVCGGSGGGIYLDDFMSLLTINGTISINNNKSQKEGGGVANYGRVEISATGTGTINTNIVLGYHYGGGICNFNGSSCNLSGSGTITKNSTRMGKPAGGGIYNYPFATYSNTGWTVTDNTPDDVATGP